jgi:hypothetical protein
MKRDWWYWHDRHVQFLIIKTIALIYSDKSRKIRKMLARREKDRQKYERFDRYRNRPNT